MFFLGEQVIISLNDMQINLYILLSFFVDYLSIEIK